MPHNPLSMIMPSLTKKPLRVPDQGYGANTGASLYDLQGQLADETFERRFNARRSGAPPEQLNALLDLLNRYEGERARSPITQQGAEVADFNAQNRSAILEGFGGGESGPPMISSTMDIDPVSGGRYNESITETPAPHVSPIVARNLYKRKMEQEALRQPLRQEEMRQRGAIQQQQIQSDAARDVERMRGQSARDVAQTTAQPQSEYYGLQKMLMEQSRQGQLPPIDSLSKSSINFANPPNQQSMLNQGTVVKQNLANRGGEMWLNPDVRIPEQAAYNSFVGNLIATSPIDSLAKEEITKALQNREFARLPTDQFIDQVFDASQLTSAERGMLVDLLLKARGF